MRRSSAPASFPDLTVNRRNWYVFQGRLTFPLWGRRGIGGLAVRDGAMRALVTRWLPVIVMIGLLALVWAAGRTPCAPTGCGIRYR